MNEREFVSKLINDKSFLAEAFGAIPDDVLAELEAKGKAQQNQQQDEDLGRTMCEYFLPAATAMGINFDPGTFASECESQMRSLGGFAKVKFLARFVRTASKVTKKKKRK